MPQSTTLAVIILTHNESNHIARAIRSVLPFASELFVIDDGSSDGTPEIARGLGATVLTHPFVNQARQLNWALEQAAISADWVFRLDADEIIEPDLAQTLVSRLQALPAAVTGVALKRKHIFMGRWIKYGGRYPVELLRIWRRGAGRAEDRWMDEHVVLSHGRTVVFDGGFADVNLRDLSYFVEKHNKYATREAVEVLNLRRSLFPRDHALESNAGQAAFKRILKERFYSRLPFGIGPLSYFLYRYILQLGFLDGKEGAIYHGLQALWYRFLVEAKVLELERSIRGLDRTAALEMLVALTGLKLMPASDSEAA